MFLTPPVEHTTVVLRTASNLLLAQAAVLKDIAQQYGPAGSSENALLKSLTLMYDAVLSSGKIVITGMGKSLVVARKLVATFCSLGITAVPLHPCDALHGDLGIIGPRDVLLIISASGQTPEIINLLQHVPSGLPLIAMTCEPSSDLAKSSTCVLPVRLKESWSEARIYGLPAPTITTTACLAIGDSICVTLNEMIQPNAEERVKTFARLHPGGTIGKSYHTRGISSRK